MRKRSVVLFAAISLVAVTGIIVVATVSNRGMHTPSLRNVEQNQLRNLSLAILQEVDRGGGRFISAIYDKNGKSLLSWRVKMLPYLEEKPLYDLFHLDEPWDSDHNKTLIQYMPSTYRSLLCGDLHGKTVFQVPTGSETIFFDTKGTSPEQITDGPQNTILLVETDADHAVPWTKPEDITIDPRDPASRLAHFHSGVFLVVRANGRVSGLFEDDDLDAATLWSYFTRGGGEGIPWPGK